MVSAEEKELRSAKGWYLDRKKILRLRVLRGLCRICCRPREPSRKDRVLCQKCSDKDKARQMHTYYERKHRGICPRCEHPLGRSA